MVFTVVNVVEPLSLQLFVDISCSLEHPIAVCIPLHRINDMESYPYTLSVPHLFIKTGNHACYYLIKPQLQKQTWRKVVQIQSLTLFLLLFYEQDNRKKFTLTFNRVADDGDDDDYDNDDDDNDDDDDIIDYAINDDKIKVKRGKWELEKNIYTKMGNQKTCAELFYLLGEDVDITQCPDNFTKSSTKSRSMHLYTLKIRVCVDRM